MGLCTSSAHTHNRSLAQKQDTCTCKGQCKRAHAPRLSGCICSIIGSVTRPWATAHTSARLAQQMRLTAANRLRDRALQPQPEHRQQRHRSPAPRRSGVRGGRSPTASTAAADADDAPASRVRLRRLAPAPSAMAHARHIPAQTERCVHAAKTSTASRRARTRCPLRHACSVRVLGRAPASATDFSRSIPKERRCSTRAYASLSTMPTVNLASATELTVRMHANAHSTRPRAAHHPGACS